MRKLCIFPVGLAALVCASVASAQSPLPPGPEDDLKCAAWAAVVIGVNKDNPEVVKSLTSGLMWFLGRYETETGKKFEEGLTAEYLTRVGPELAGAEAHCQTRLREMGQRLIDWGHTLQKSGEQEAQKAPAK